ncbi:MAG: bifunctional metallophosphatase/5'-nucleotidase [Fibrobacterota bacterium]
MRSLLANSILLVGILASGSIAAPEDTFRLTLVHVNDIHAHLDPSPVNLATTPPVQAMVGGAARMATAFAQLRLVSSNVLYLHAGDEFSGTPWFSVYKGLADAAVMNRLRFDAFVPGNHEFDQGPGVLGTFLDSLRAPAVAANLDASNEPALRDKFRPAIMRTFGRRKVAVVGLALPETPNISSPGPNVRFRSAMSVQRTIDSVRREGASVVVLLSHAGLDVDTVIARKLSGVSCIVGGHSHTRMGTAFSQIGLSTKLPYPVVVRTKDGAQVPVVQSWEWGKVVGQIDLELDAEGRAISWEGHPFMPSSDTLRSGGQILPDSIAIPLKKSMSCPGFLRFLKPDPAMSGLLARLGGPLDSLRRSPVATLAEPLSRKDGALLEICAKSLLSTGTSWGATVGLMNNGGVRDDLAAGTVTREDILKVAPFDNTVIVLTLTGTELAKTVRNLSSHHGHRVGIAGAQIVRDSADRIAGIRLAGAKSDLTDSDTVRIATNSYLASGGDGCTALKNAARFRLDTGVRDAGALADWLGAAFPVK